MAQVLSAHGQKVVVKEFLAALAVGTMSPSLKRTFLPKVMASLIDGKRLMLVSLDLEAYCPGDPRFHPDALLLVAGMQKLVFEKWGMKVEKPAQYMADGKSSVEIAKLVHEYCEGADAILGHYSKWDVDILRNYEPVLQARYGGFIPLPAAMIDVMQPVRNLGISAGQEHICSHYDLGVEKGKVNLEEWQDAAIGETWGLTKAQVMRARRRIRDERNKTCLAANLAEIAFISQNARFMNKLTTKEVYPNVAKMEALLGEN